jgi:hypothetical protein
VSESPHDDSATIQLDADTASILIELLYRWMDHKSEHVPADACFESPAECGALSEVLAQLERQLVAPFRDDYFQLLEAARVRNASTWHGGFLGDPPPEA